MWVYSQENVPERRREEFAALICQELKVGRAEAIKEALRRLAQYLSGIRLDVPDTVVLLGDAQLASADSQGSGDDSSAHQ